jgi:hypothetical protein
MGIFNRTRDFDKKLEAKRNRQEKKSVALSVACIDGAEEDN